MTRRVLAVAVAAALVLVACGATEPDAPSTTTTTDAGDETPAPPPSGPGVTDTEVRVGFIITDLTRIETALGLDVPEQGDVEAQILAITEYVNETGGIGGRTMVPFIREFDALLDSPLVEEELCNAVTQDDEVFAVVLTGQFQDNARPCYAGRQTLMLDTTFYPVDVADHQELAPYLWSFTVTEYSNLVTALITGLALSGWFEGATLGVLGPDNAITEAAYDNAAAPVLDRLGIDVAERARIDTTDAGTFQPSIDAAVLEFKDAGVTHVITLGGNRVQPFFMQFAELQNYTPTYALTSYDSPVFSIESFPASVEGASGVSVVPAYDIADDQYAFPANPTEELCIEIMERTGDEFPTRANARTGLQYCDAALLLQRGAANLTDTLDAARWTEAIWDLGDTFQLASTYRTRFFEGSYTGADAYGVTAFDPACECLVLESEPLDLTRSP